MRGPAVSTLVLSAMFVLFALSCATTRRYESMLEGWVGKDSKTLEQKWGTPVRIGAYGDGRKLWEYRFTDRHEGKTEGVREVAGGRTGCTTFFVVSPSGVVEAWKWEGDDCIAK